MPDDDDHLQANIFQSEVSAEQHRLAVRYDALRGALGKFGRPFRSRSALILPAPVLLLDPDDVWEAQRGDYRSRQALLVFANGIARADSVTLWDALGNRVADAYDFAARARIPVDDPGEGGSVEVRDRHGVTFMVGIPLRIPVDTETYLAADQEDMGEADEEDLGEADEEDRAEGRDESATKTSKE